MEHTNFKKIVYVNIRKHVASIILKTSTDFASKKVVLCVIVFIKKPLEDKIVKIINLYLAQAVMVYTF